MRTHSICAFTARPGAVLTIVLGFAAFAHAQTTVVLEQPGTEVTDTMVQGGTSANLNFGSSDTLATRASTNADYLRRTLLKFDTQNTIAANTKIATAILTLTVKAAGSATQRTVGAFPIASSFQDREATWNIRKASTPWPTAGGDLGVKAAEQTVTNVIGSKVNIDVTALVQSVISNGTSSRYSRIALADLGDSTSGSYREYYSSKASDPSARPVLTVTIGTTTTPPPPPPPPPTTGGATLRVMQYNTHHGGYGTDGVYNIDRLIAWIVKGNPDVVSLQEIEINDSWSKGLDQCVIYRDKLHAATGRTWYKAYQNRYGGTSGNGECIVSTIPFVAAAGTLLYDERSALDVTIDVNGRLVNFASLHLDNEFQSSRIKEVAEFLPWFGGFAENRILVGDFNAWPNTTEIATINQTYTDTYLAAQALGTASSFNITHGAHRIDYIYLSKGSPNLKVVSQTIYNTKDANGVAPSDHNPVLTVFNVQ